MLHALIALGRASLWTEHTEEALACAERSLELADENGDLEMRGPALALLSQVYGQRGEEGDLGRALELGDRALEKWVPGARANDLALHESLQALTHYWTGRYASAAELGRRADDGATEALALVGLGRAEEAIARSGSAIVSAREAGSAKSTPRTRSVVRPRRSGTYSTSTRRDVGTRKRSSSFAASGSKAV